eukprot:3936257-Rhodomonas_salina.1
MTLGSLTVTWNSNVGQWWVNYVIGVLEVIRNVFEQAVGAYNFAVYVLFKLPSNLLLHMLAGGILDLKLAGEDIG